MSAEVDKVLAEAFRAALWLDRAAKDAWNITTGIKLREAHRALSALILVQRMHAERRPATHEMARVLLRNIDPSWPYYDYDELSPEAQAKIRAALDAAESARNWHPLRPDCTPEHHTHETPDPWGRRTEPGGDRV